MGNLRVAAIVGGVGVEATVLDGRNGWVNNALASNFTSVLSSIVWRIAVDVGIVQDTSAVLVTNDVPGSEGTPTGELGNFATPIWSGSLGNMRCKVQAWTRPMIVAIRSRSEHP